MRRYTFVMFRAIARLCVSLKHSAEGEQLCEQKAVRGVLAYLGAAVPSVGSLSAVRWELECTWCAV